MTEISLKKKSVLAMLWSGAEIFSKQGLQFIVSVVLARLLGPSEYGTIALLYIFIELAGVFADSGLSSALVHRQDLSREDESSVFWFHAFSGLLLSILLSLLAPYIAGFYDKPVLKPLLQVMALSFFITALGSIQHVLLTKKLDFKRPMQVAMISGVFSGALAIVMAYQGFGVWALAMQTLATSIITTFSLWWVSDWRPHLVFNWEVIRRLFSYGGYLMLSDLLMVTYNRIYTLYIGKVYSVKELGLYSRADNTKQIPLDLISRMYAQVAFPVFSKASKDRQKLRKGVRYALKSLMLITLPIMMGLMVTAQEVIVVLFGEQWLETAPLMKILCLAGVFWPLQILNINLQKALGHSRLIFKAEILKKVLGIGFVIVALPYGITGIAWSQVAYGVMSFILNAYFSGRSIGYGLIRQLDDMMPIILVTALMAISVYQFGLVYDFEPLIGLMAKAGLGAVVFVLAAILFRLNIIKDLRLILSSRQMA